MSDTIKAACGSAEIRTVKMSHEEARLSVFAPAADMQKVKDATFQPALDLLKVRGWIFRCLCTIRMRRLLKDEGGTLRVKDEDSRYRESFLLKLSFALSGAGR